MRKGTSIVVLLCGVALATSAAEVSLESARFAAQAWIDSGLSLGKLRGRCAAQAETLEEGDARMHVVKLDGGGFVVMGADDLVEPVIAFSAGGAPVEADSEGPLPAILKADLAERARASARRSTARAPMRSSPRTTRRRGRLPSRSTRRRSTSGLCSPVRLSRGS